MITPDKDELTEIEERAKFIFQDTLAMAGGFGLMALLLFLGFSVWINLLIFGAVYAGIIYVYSFR